MNTLDAPLLLSDRAAARLLGVSRDTLAALRRAGQIRTVSWPGRIGYRIPLREVERVAVQGVTVTGHRPRQSRRRSTGNPAAAILAIKVEDL